MVIAAAAATRDRERHGRGWVTRRALLGADLVGLTVSFALTEVFFGHALRTQVNDRFAIGLEFVAFALTLPIWVAAAKLYGLYEYDGERADHSTVDELAGIFHLVTIGAWIVYVASHLTSVASPTLPKMAVFNVLAAILIIVGRVVARSLSRKHGAYIQNTVIVGAGDVGQLLARKLQLHPEYGIRLLGFVDPSPREARKDIADMRMLGRLEDLERIVHELAVERVVFAFSLESEQRLLDQARELRKMGIQIDLVPRLFEAVAPRASLHWVEGMPLIALPSVRLSRSSLLLKRLLDVVVSSLLLLLLAPLFAYIAIRVRLDSPGPVLFKQRRLGMNQREFTVLKFRTMFTNTAESYHRSRVAQTMSSALPVGTNGLYKNEDASAITPVGRWLRKSSLDELPQLLNILRGDMSLVGPRPCIPYEVEHFKPHQFERFFVPQGLTGLWQVTARSKSTFGEALEMDVAYARGWSFWLDLRLLFRTPHAVIRQRGAV